MTKNIEVPGFVIPGIEDITRRDFLVGGAAALLFGGCKGGSKSESSRETQTVEDGLGRSVEVPVIPQRVVVLDPGEVIFDLVDLGLVPTGRLRTLPPRKAISRRFLARRERTSSR